VGDPPQEALKYVESLERRVVEIKGNGNCLFRALAFLVYATDVHIQMRELLADFISRNKVQFSKLTDKIDEHILKLKYQRVLGSALELQVIASLFQLPVYTLLPNREGTYKWIIYNPQDDTTPLEPPPPKVFFRSSRANKCTLMPLQLHCRPTWPLSPDSTSTSTYC